MCVSSFVEMFFFVKSFCEPQRKLVIENKPRLGALKEKPTPRRILEI